MTEEAPELYRLATIGRPRGLRGEVRLHLHTDNPEVRLAPGRTVFTDPDSGPLTVADLKHLDASWYARFEGRNDRTSVESLVHTVLLDEGMEEEDAWYPDQLKGLRVLRPSGEEIGLVVDLEHYPAHDMLVIKEPQGERTLIPFVEEIVPRVDLSEGVVIVDAPAGLLAADGDPL